MKLSIAAAFACSGGPLEFAIVHRAGVKGIPHLRKFKATPAANVDIANSRYLPFVAIASVSA